MQKGWERNCSEFCCCWLGWVFWWGFFVFSGFAITDISRAFWKHLLLTCVPYEDCVLCWRLWATRTCFCCPSTSPLASWVFLMSSLKFSCHCAGCLRLILDAESKCLLFCCWTNWRGEVPFTFGVLGASLLFFKREYFGKLERCMGKG